MAQYIPVVFPNYAVGSAGTLTVPVGHAGVMIVNDNGSASYYEWGRYQRTTSFVVTSNAMSAGNLRTFDLTPVPVNNSGQLDLFGIKSALDQISTHVYANKDTGVVFTSSYQITQSQADQINATIQTQSFTPFGIFSNSCFLFVQRMAATVGLVVATDPITKCCAWRGTCRYNGSEWLGLFLFWT